LDTVAKRAQVEDPEMLALLEAGTSEVDWVAQEFSSIDLSDKRLNRRLVKTAQKLAKAPLSPINAACGDWAATQAAYRLFDNEKAAPEAILAAHTKETVKRMVADGGPVLVLQDTVFFSFAKHPKTEGLGPIGASNEDHDRGLVMHNALAFTTAGVPLGILSQHTWARKEVPEEGYQEKIERLQCTRIEEKESSKWLVGLSETRAHRVPGVQIVTVADRESDCFEFLTQAKEQRAKYLIRARTDRQLESEDSAGYESILEAITVAPLLGTMTVDIPGNGKRKKRTATVEVRTAKVTLKPPQRRGQAKASGSTEPLTVTVVAATEMKPPADIESISWVLLTNLAVKDLADATEKIEWYRIRWSIETWHKVMKSGCKVEDCRLEHGVRLQRYLTLFSIIAVRLMRVTYLARAQPEAPATTVFSAAEIEALQIRCDPNPTPPSAPTLREAVRMLGRLGGHLGRKCDKEPGVTVLWRGSMCLYETVETLRAYRSRHPNSS
jgi:hypothetical protein